MGQQFRCDLLDLGVQRWLVPWALVLALLAPGSVGAATCRPPAELMTLITVLSAMPEGQPASETGRLRIAAAMRRIDEDLLVRRLEAAELSSATPTVLDLLSETTRVVDNESLRSHARLDALMETLHMDLELACDGGLPIFQKDQKVRLGGLMPTERRSQLRAINAILEENTTLRFGVLSSAVLILVGGLFLGDAGFRWVMALVYNRKACRIVASIHIGEVEVEGLIITLGRGGCRFQPLNMATFDSVLAELRSTQIEICVVDDSKGHLLSARASAIYADCSDFRFAQRLSLKIQRDLLRHSSISPFYVKKSKKKRGPLSDGVTRPDDSPHPDAPAAEDGMVAIQATPEIFDEDDTSRSGPIAQQS